MFCCLLKKELTFTLSRLGTNYVSFSQVKFLVFEAQPVFSKLSEAAPLDERDRISITSTPSLHYRTMVAPTALSCFKNRYKCNNPATFDVKIRFPGNSFRSYDIF